MEGKEIVELIRERARLKRRIREIDQALCSHDGETYRSIDWSYDNTCCSQCHKVLIKHR
jgi:hypothetical protein